MQSFTKQVSPQHAAIFSFSYLHVIVVEGGNILYHGIWYMVYGILLLSAFVMNMLWAAIEQVANK